ncbi:MAG TPA: ECF-type sigma factor [Gemmataceae bacterium]|nr:ECF-type sigma factor [Gemmataceae bacterium]
MTPQGSVSGWIHQIHQGDSRAAAELWRRYFPRLVGLARAVLGSAPRRMADEEDAAPSAFDSFCRGAEEGRFPDLCDRDSLWRLLVVLTRRKAVHQGRHEQRQKRGGGAVLDQAGVARAAGSPEEAAGDLDWLADGEPTPAFAAEVAEECQRLLRLLPNDDLRSLAVCKMEGYTNEEVAAKVGCCLSTVERRLQLIRRLWSEERPHA